jgi:hypothetical protein
MSWLDFLEKSFRKSLIIMAARLLEVSNMALTAISAAQARDADDFVQSVTRTFRRSSTQHRAGINGKYYTVSSSCRVRLKCFICLNDNKAHLTAVCSFMHYAEVLGKRV